MRVAGAAQVGGDLLAPLERRVPRPGPGRRVVRRECVGAPRVEAAVLLDQGELLLRRQRDPVLHRQLVERAGERALHAGAVVAEDVEDERVLELAHLLDRVEQPPDVPVGVLLEAGVDLHLPRVQLLLVLRERVPGREALRSGRQLGVGRDHAQLLLPLERLLAEHVPALVELAPVLARSTPSAPGAARARSRSSSRRTRASSGPAPAPRAASSTAWSVRSSGR